MQSAFDMTVEWAFDRYTFGRPLASYQALKHRYADMMSWLEAGHAISDVACAAVQEQAANADELTSAARRSSASTAQSSFRTACSSTVGSA